MPSIDQRSAELLTSPPVSPIHVVPSAARGGPPVKASRPSFLQSFPASFLSPHAWKEVGPFFCFFRPTAVELKPISRTCPSPSPRAGAPSLPPSGGEEHGAATGASSSAAPQPDSILGDCAHCGARARLKFCNRCQVTRYCGRDCQTADVRGEKGGRLKGRGSVTREVKCGPSLCSEAR